MGTQWFGWWHEADWVVRGVFVTLVVMSVAGWTVILFKSWQFGRITGMERRFAGLLANGDGGGHPGPSAAFAPLRHGEGHQDSLLAQILREIRMDLDSGLAVLATIGNTAPFIGLLGTVWGIMHALQGLDGETAMTLALVAGPVAEALVATAAGLFAAIPAVMGYNMLLRRLARLLLLIEGNGRRMLAAPDALAPAGTTTHATEQR